MSYSFDTRFSACLVAAATYAQGKDLTPREVVRLAKTFMAEFDSFAKENTGVLPQPSFINTESGPELFDPAIYTEESL